MKKFFISLFIFLFISVTSWAVAVGGTNIPHFYNIGGVHSLILNGTAVTKKWGMNAYVHALYLPQKNRDAEAIIVMNQPMVLRVIVRSNFISVRSFQKALLNGFDEQALAQSSSLQRSMDLFLSAFSNGVRKGDVYDISWDPAGKLKIYKNMAFHPIVEIPGSEIKKAAFSCWLGNDQKLQSLRLGLLGN